MYAEAQQQAQASPSGNGDSGSDDEVVEDAEYEDVTSE
jgi:hypothetical protein